MGTTDYIFGRDKTSNALFSKSFEVCVAHMEEPLRLICQTYHSAQFHKVTITCTPWTQMLIAPIDIFIISSSTFNTIPNSTDYRYPLFSHLKLVVLLSTTITVSQNGLHCLSGYGNNTSSSSLHTFCSLIRDTACSFACGRLGFLDNACWCLDSINAHQFGLEDCDVVVSTTIEVLYDVRLRESRHLLKVLPAGIGPMPLSP